ncbi:MAG TPA: uracil-DNA glycosylase, partial [Bacteroidales bacterium]|nr:uracil-DNA glycosylase [Bacteroidales bacterium]
CFSVNEGTPHPKSLVNIFKELQNDIGFTVPKSGNLEKWAKQGILMINAILTVRAHSPGSHRNKGWETFTDAVIRKLSTDRDGLIFILWGAFAQEKSALIDTTKHRILRAAHPSPFSAHKGFFGCKHFSKTNEILRKMGKSEIDWSL